MTHIKVGIVGCGTISGIYLKNLASRWEFVTVAAVADLERSRAQARAREFGVERVLTTEELLADGDIRLVVNLTTPPFHASVCRQALEAGKSVYVEKPLALTTEEADEVLALAERKGLLVGCAPDTFLGSGQQTCRRLVDEGAIGEVVAAVAFMAGHGHESWHPDPEFYYKRGGGPMLDMGPYYLTALVNLLGPIDRVSGSARMSFPERTITSKPKAGTKITVETPTHLAGTLDFASGAIGTVVMSFDVWKHNLPRIELYGTKGSLSVPDPNTFGGPVKLFRQGESDWSEIPLIDSGYNENSRGLGVADMALAIAEKRTQRAAGQVGRHVLEAMLAFEKSSLSGQSVRIGSRCSRPEPLGIAVAERTGKTSGEKA